MDFSFSEEEMMVQREVRKFCEKEIAPHAIKVDRKEMLPYEHFPKLVKHGYFAPSLPEDYGGAGASLTISSIIGTEIARACPSTSLSVAASVLLCAGTIFNSGSPEQKERYIPSIARGEKIGCWGMTEPNAGSDIASLQTTAEKDGDYYILNGTKTFITNAPYSDILVVYAVTTKGAGHNGISAFILEKGMKGLTLGKPMLKMGFRGSPTGEIFMEDVRVKREHLLGTENMGFWEALQTLNDERALAPGLAVGMMERCLETSIKYAKERVQFGRPIATRQAIQLKLARMYTLLEHTRSMAWRLVWMREKKMNYAKEASCAKLFCAEAAFEVAKEAIQILGGYGYMEEYEMERFLRDAKLLEIGGGTSEIQQLIIARMLLGM